MGINIILSLIMGIAMTVIIGSQVAPSFIEQMKIAKVENRTIANQNIIKDAIVRYIKMEGKVPRNLEELKTFGLLKDYHEINLFDGGYTFAIDEEKGTLKIFTTINDNGAGKYFSNSVKFPNKPTCFELNGDGTCKNNVRETFYLLDEDTFKASDLIPKKEVGSNENIEDKFTNLEEVGEKFDKDTLVGGEKDYVVNIANNKVEEFIYNKTEEKWKCNGYKDMGGIGKSTGVEIKNGIVSCKNINPALLEKEVFVINEDTKLGEIIWVAPNDVPKIKNKISDNYIANNMCVSNVTNMSFLFQNETNFNQPLNRWDTSNVTNMNQMFYYATNFNQPLNFNTSNVTTMNHMFFQATNFNQPLNFNASNVTDMYGMFRSATKFNQPLNFNTSNVTTMSHMFYQATNFNQDLSSWCVRKIGSEPSFFDNSSAFYNKPSMQPKWGQPCSNP